MSHHSECKVVEQPFSSIQWEAVSSRGFGSAHLSERLQTGRCLSRSSIVYRAFKSTLFETISDMNTE